MKRTKERQWQFDVAYMKMAYAIAELSYAEKKKVGAIIVSCDDQVISQGFNGTPSGFDNQCEDKLPDGSLKTRPEVLHAETNAITKCARYGNTSTKGATLYITLSPCIHCAKTVIQSGISRVVFDEDWDGNEGAELLTRAGIEVQQLHLPDII